MTSQPAASRRRSDSSSPFIDDLALSCRHVGQGAGDPAFAPEDRSPAGNYIRGAMIVTTRLVSRGQGQVLGRCTVVEDHEEVDVTVRTGVAARCRTEQD